LGDCVVAHAQRRGCSGRDSRPRIHRATAASVRRGNRWWVPPAGDSQL